MALVPDENIRMALCESGVWLYLVWVFWPMDAWSGPLHMPSWKFRPQESTRLREQVGAKILLSSLHIAKPCIQGGGGGVGCGYTLRKRNLFLIFPEVLPSLEFFVGHMDVMNHQYWAKSFLFSRFYIICWSHSRPAVCRTMSLMLSQRDLRESLVHEYHGKEDKTGADDPGWILVLTFPPCMAVGDHPLASASSPVRWRVGVRESLRSFPTSDFYDPLIMPAKIKDFTLSIFLCCH